MNNLDLFAGNLNRILLVDPLQDNTAWLETYLATHHVQLITSEHGEEALALLSALQPDLIMLNEFLPDQQFTALIQAIQSHPKACHIPIIVLTQHLQQKQKKHAFDYLDRLFKPLNPHVLIKLLHNYAQMFASRKIVSALHNHHDQLLEAKNEGLLALNQLGQIVYANNAAARLLGFKPSVLLGIYIESLFDGQGAHLDSHWKNHPIAKITNEKNILQVEKAFFSSAEGTQLPVKFAAVPVFDEKLVSVVIAFQLRESTVNVLVDEQSDYSEVRSVVDDPTEVDAVFTQADPLSKQDKLDDVIPPSSSQPAVSKSAVSKSDRPQKNNHQKQSQQMLMSPPQAQVVLPTELVLNDYLQKIYDSAAVYPVSGVYLFQVNHWRYLIEGLGREIIPHVITSIRQLMLDQLPETVAADYLENGQFCLLSKGELDFSLMIEMARRLQSLLASPLICLGHTFFLSVCVGGTGFKEEALVQVSMRLRQALLLAQEEGAEGIAVIGVDASNIERQASSVKGFKQSAIANKSVGDAAPETLVPTCSQGTTLTQQHNNPLNQDWLRGQSSELQLRPFFDLQNNMIMGLNVSPLYQHPTLGWQELDELCTYYRSNPDFIAIAQRLIELFMQRLALELRGEDLPASCQICLKIPAALLGVSDFYAGFIQSILEAGIVGESLWIELPESAWRVNSPIFLANIKAMHLHGIGLVVSEFGQALAPLALLDKLPISAIKFASKITEHADLYRDKLWLKTLKELAQSNHIKLWATQFSKQSRAMLVSELGITLTDGPSFEFSESGLSVAEFYALTQEVCLNTSMTD
jgi:EAL domain-containing protein (putative c-di-GMP-specific phosphodiesterase class I)/CheY-like chemotaxis protein